MAFLHFDNVFITALAGAIPSFVQKIPLDADHPDAPYIKSFVKKTGITRRHISITEQTSTDLGLVAAKALLEKACWDVNTIDAIIYLTQTPDFNAATGNAYVMHNHLQLPETTLCLDIAQGCAGFPYGLAIGGSLLQQPNINRILIVSGDTMWPAYESRETLLSATTFLTGEGTAAFLLEKKPALPIDIELCSDGSGYHYLYNPWEGVRHAWRRNAGLLPNGEIYKGGPYMDGMEITAFATMRIVESIKKFLVHFHTSIDSFDGVILHQANGQIVKTMGRRLKITPEKLPTTFDSLANTNVASVPLTIVNAYAGSSGPLHLLACAFGIGLSWGIADFTLDTDVILPMITTNAINDEDFLRPLPEDAS